MPSYADGDLNLEYERFGRGFPVLLFAPGGMRSAMSVWERAPWNPITALAGDFEVIAMDQRNAGGSHAPISAGDGWHSYSDDHVALLDHLGVERCHVLGGCIGGSYCLGLMARAPGRVAAAVLQQPIGFDDNRQAFYEMFDGWAGELRKQRPEIGESDWAAFRENMYGGDFVFNVDRGFVEGCDIPMLVLMGDDLYHPQSTSREIAELAPNATLIEDWKSPTALSETPATVNAFLKRHTPG